MKEENTCSWHNQEGATTGHSQKTQGFCVADFATLFDERTSRSKAFLLFNTDKGTFRSKIERVSKFENSYDFAN